MLEGLAAEPESTALSSSHRGEHAEAGRSGSRHVQIVRELQLDGGPKGVRSSSITQNSPRPEGFGYFIHYQRGLAKVQREQIVCQTRDWKIDAVTNQRPFAMPLYLGRAVIAKKKQTQKKQN